MALVFQSPARPQSLMNLDDSLAQEPLDTISALVCAIRDATFATCVKEHLSFLVLSLKALHIQESLFRPALSKLTYEWVPTAKEQVIIQTAWHGLYSADDIEGAFFKDGGLHGIVALLLLVRDTELILKQWDAIEDKDVQQWLVSNVAALFRGRENRWMLDFVPQAQRKQRPLQYLIPQSRKRKSRPETNLALSQARSHQLPSPHRSFLRKYREPLERHDGERGSCQQASSTSPTSSPDQFLDDEPSITSSNLESASTPSHTCTHSSVEIYLQRAKEGPLDQFMDCGQNSEESVLQSPLPPGSGQHWSLPGNTSSPESSSNSDTNDSAGSVLSLSHPSLRSFESPGFAHIVTDNDNPIRSPSPSVSNNLTSPSSSRRSTINHTLANILNTGDYIHALKHYDDGKDLSKQAENTLPYPQWQHPAYERDGRQYAVTNSSTSLSRVSLDIITEFQNLDFYCRDLATLLVFLGHADIPKSMLLRVSKPKEYFSPAGEVSSIPAPDLNPLFACSQYLDWALKHLEALALISIKNDDESIKVLPALQSVIESTLGGARRVMEYKASLLVFHSLPEKEDVDYTKEVEMYKLSQNSIPLVEHVLKYFEAPNFVHQFSPPQRERIVSSCLWATGFGTLPWKLNVLAVAERIMSASPANSLLSAKLRFRRLVLCYQNPTIFKNTYLCNLELAICPTDVSSNTFLAEHILFHVQVLIYRDELSRGWLELREMESKILLDANRPEERRLLQTKQCYQIRICLFAGEFDHVKRLVVKLLQESPISQSVQPQIFSYYISGNCESATLEAAFTLMPFLDCMEVPWQDVYARGRRGSLAAAGTCLMKGLLILKKNCEGYGEAQQHLLRAKAIYETLNKFYSNRTSESISSSIRHFSVSSGLAMIAHLEWRFASNISGELALSYWETAHEVGETSGRNLGGTPFPQIIISYSMCDITVTLGLLSETIAHMNKAKSLFQDTGRQFHYLALGSIWFDMVQDWSAGHGLGRISELIYEDYMTEQRKGGFPYRKDSLRLCK